MQQIQRLQRRAGLGTIMALQGIQRPELPDQSRTVIQRFRPCQLDRWFQLGSEELWFTGKKKQTLADTA